MSIRNAEICEWHGVNCKSRELNDPIWQDILDAIEALDQKTKNDLYLNVKITLPELAYKLEIPAYQLSQAINRKSGLNFNDFINRFRTEYCKNILLDEKYNHYTMEAIGELSGFKSRQTFIKSFKKFYNQTPSEFLKINRQAV